MHIRGQWILSKCSKEDKILDIGSAGGCIFQYSGLNVVCLDINEFWNPQFPQVVANAHALPFEDGSFEICCLNEILEHATNPLMVLREACRVARKKVIYTVPNEWDWDKSLKPCRPMTSEGLKTQADNYMRASPGCVKVYGCHYLRDGRVPCFELPHARGKGEIGGREDPNTIHNLVGMGKKPSVYRSTNSWSLEERRENKMKILLISTPVFVLTTEGLSGYGGLEWLVAKWAIELKKLGCEVSVVCPEGSNLGEGIEIIPIGLRESEETAYLKYKDKLTSGEFDTIFDNSWSWWSVISQQEADHQLPILHMYHSDPYNLGSTPPIQFPCLVSPSRAQADIISRRWGTPVRIVPHGTDLEFYKPDPEVKRGNRWLFLARYTPEKGFREIAYLARKCKVGLDAYGDTEIISSRDYLNACMADCDQRQVVFHSSIPREETVKQYQSHKALITWPNYIEIFGLVTVEAMACGTPVISKDSGAARELIKQGKTGFVVSTLEEAEELIKSDVVSKIEPEDCRKQAERFSIQASAKKYLKLFEEVASGVPW